MPVFTIQPLPASVAFLTHTREYQASALMTALDRSEYSTIERFHDDETEHMLGQFRPALVVLAVDPSSGNDLDLIRSVARTSTARLLILGPGPGCEGFAAALSAGADVCIRETDGQEVVAAQVEAFARRRAVQGSTSIECDAPNECDVPHSITVGEFTLDFDRCQAFRNARPLAVTTTEFKLLALLAKSAGKVISPSELLRGVHDYAYSEKEARETVKVFVRRIRRKIDLPGATSFVTTVRGFGYLFECNAAGQQPQRLMLLQPESEGDEHECWGWG